MQELQQHPLHLAVEELKKMPTIEIEGKYYTQVSIRLSVFRKYFPEASIVTTLIHDDNNRVIVQAQISIDGTVVSTGLSEEFRGNSAINSTSALENAETSAIGRALASLSLHGNEYASSFEVANAIAQQNQTNQHPQTNQSHNQTSYTPNNAQQPQRSNQPVQNYTMLNSLGLQVINDGANLIVSGENIYAHKNEIKGCGFKWNGANRQWYKPLTTQQAA